MVVWDSRQELPQQEQSLRRVGMTTAKPSGRKASVAMSEEHSQIEQPPPFGEIPEEFIDPEGDGELGDPSLALESTADMRREWSDWLCSNGPGKFANVQFFGKGIGGVPAPAVDAFKALEAALRATGYQPRSSWSNKCRKIAGTSRYSLHSFGIAIDIDPRENPQSAGSPYSGKIQQAHVDAVLQIRNMAGRRIWQWGGTWSRPDRMHFQLDQGPDAVVVDPSTVPGAVTVSLEAVTHRVTATSLNMRTEPTLSGALMAELYDGAEVAAQGEPGQQSDGYEWLKIGAVVGGQLATGWVASEFLENLDSGSREAGPGATPAEVNEPEPAIEPAVSGATHRVRASSLNLRTEPTTSGVLIVSLPDGTQVAVQEGPAEEADDYEWIRVKAELAGATEEGWVASKYLEEVR
jgi:uncharacterized protein YgiM (DUF1202 family)